MWGTRWIVKEEMGEVKWFEHKAYPRLRFHFEADVTALTWAMSCMDNLG